jgi:hypothetical protein
VKIICILVMTLLITTTISAMGMPSQKNDNEKLIIDQTSCARAPSIPNVIEKTTYPLDMGGVPFYGYVAYDPLNILTLGPCSFMPTTPGIIISLAPTSSTDFLSGGTWASGVWYGCEWVAGSYTNSYIWTINPLNGVMTFVGSYNPGGTGLSFNGLAYDPTTNKLYGCSNTDLYTVDMSTGASTLVGSFGIGGYMIGIAFDASGNLYGTELLTDSLYSINTLGGSATLVGSLNIDIHFAQDMSFDLDTGILYLAAYTATTVWEGALYTCNPTTGATAKVGTFQNAAEITCFAIPYNSVPTPPIISGPLSGKVNTPLTYSFTSWDPDLDQISYYVDWGDGPPTWSTFQNSGIPYSASHTWSAQGTYTISAKAKDTQGAESSISTLTVTIPRDKAIQTSPFLQFLQSHPNMFPILQKLIQNLGL